MMKIGGGRANILGRRNYGNEDANDGRCVVRRRVSKRCVQRTNAPYTLYLTDPLGREAVLQALKDIAVKILTGFIP